MNDAFVGNVIECSSNHISRNEAIFEETIRPAPKDTRPQLQEIGSTPPLALLP